MAILGATSLTGCDSIPSFIAAGSKSVFNMATSPVSWTKFNAAESTLRVVTGATLSPGGSSPFTTVFSASKPISATANLGAIAASVSQVAGLTTPRVSSSDGGAGTTGGTALPSAQFTAHNHPVIALATTPTSTTAPVINHAPSVLNPSAQTGSGGVGLQHTHTVDAHSHNLTGSPTTLHTHVMTQHSHPFSSTQNFNLAYVDVIIATKD